MLVRDGVVVCKVHLHIAPDAAEAPGQAAGEQDDALARDRGRPLAGAQLPRKSSAPSSTCWPPRTSRSRPGTSWTAPTDSTRAGGGPAAARRGRACRRPAAGHSCAARGRGCAVALPPAQQTCGRAPSEDDYEAELERCRARLALLSRRKRFERHSVVAAFEGMDAAGKGGAIRRVTTALDARQYRVVPISAPTPEELARPYLWRFWFQLPPRGQLHDFDRSWYGQGAGRARAGFAAATATGSGPTTRSTSSNGNWSSTG